MAEKAKTFGRNLLLELAIAKGKNYDRESITTGSPSKKQVLEGLRNVGVNDPIEIISTVQELKRRLKLWILVKKVKELGVFFDHEKNKALKLAIHIYCKDENALKDLSTYQKSEPKTKTVFYTSQKQLTMDDWLAKEEKLRNAIHEKLSDEENDSIATLDKILSLEDKIRCHIGIDYKKHVVERKKSPQYPHRKGSYDSYPLRRMVVTYDLKNNTMQISSHPTKTPKLIQILSEVLSNNPDNFQIRRPSAAEAIKSFENKKIQEQLQENNIRISEVKLKRIRMKGNPSFMHIKGENLLETINQLKESEINIVGKNIADVSEITFEFNKKKYKINYENSKIEKTGDFTPDDESMINEILSSWGVA